MDTVFPLMAAAAAAALLTACATEPSSPAAADQVGNLEAPLRGVGSAATGKVIVVDNGKGVTLTLDAANLMQGSYRLAFHANPNCNSPWGESAGPVWGPSDAANAPGTLIPVAYAGVAAAFRFPRAFRACTSTASPRCAAAASSCMPDLTSTARFGHALTTT
jgi:hypothetical protein